MGLFDSTANTQGTTTSNASGTNQSTTLPGFAPQLGALTTAFGNANNAYNQASQAVAPTNFTALQTPEQMAAYQQMVAAGTNPALSDALGGASTDMLTSGTAGSSGALTGLAGFNPSATNNTNSQVNAANQYVAGQDIPDQVQNAMLPAEQQARDVTMPGIEMGAANSGNTNSSRAGIADGLVQRGLAEQDNALTGSLTGTAFANGLNLANTTGNENNTLGLGALSSEGNIGNTSAGTGVNAGVASTSVQGADANEAAAGGAGLTAANQAELTNQAQQFNAASTAPYAALNGLMPIIGGTNWGTSTNGSNTSNSSGTSNSTTTTTPSAMSVISGLLSSGGQLLSGLNVGSSSALGTPGTSIGGSTGPTSYGGSFGPSPLV